MNWRHDFATCRIDECPACEHEAEYRNDDPGYADDWRIGQDRYERHLDRMGGAA